MVTAPASDTPAGPASAGPRSAGPPSGPFAPAPYPPGPRRDRTPPPSRPGVESDDLTTRPAVGPTPSPVRAAGLEPVSTTGYQERVADHPSGGYPLPADGYRGAAQWHDPPRRFDLVPDEADAPTPRRRRNPVLTLIKMALIGAMIVIGVSVGRTLALPGDQDALSRMADWARDNHLSVVVDQVDRLR